MKNLVRRSWWLFFGGLHVEAEYSEFSLLNALKELCEMLVG